VKVKLAQFCHVPVKMLCDQGLFFKDTKSASCNSNTDFDFIWQISNIINLRDVTNIWHIPLLLRVCHMKLLVCMIAKFSFDMVNLKAFLSL
jgi:hypothetical protein